MEADTRTPTDGSVSIERLQMQPRLPRIPRKPRRPSAVLRDRPVLQLVQAYMRTRDDRD
jgi:hypothetical protein